jgi:hypothetical protein
VAYTEKETGLSTQLTSKFGPVRSNRPAIMQPDKKKKLVSEDSTKIAGDDELAKQDIMQGRKIISYREYSDR